MSTTLIDEKQLVEMAFPKFTTSVRTNIKSGEEKSRITAIDDKDAKAEALKKYGMSIQFVWTAVSLHQAVKALTQPQSLTVGVQSHVRKLGDNKIKALVAGTEEYEFKNALRIKNGVIRVIVNEWLKIERNGAIPEPEKAKRGVDKLTDDERAELFGKYNSDGSLKE